MNTQINNEMIAEFMGFKSISTEYDTFWNPPHMGAPTIYEWKFHSLGLNFHCSWDWLMPAWFKFQNVCKELLTKHLTLTEYHYHEKKFLDGINKQEIDDCHSALVEGIKWFNSQKA